MNFIKDTIYALIPYQYLKKATGDRGNIPLNNIHNLKYHKHLYTEATSSFFFNNNYIMFKSSFSIPIYYILIGA